MICVLIKLLVWCVASPVNSKVSQQKKFENRCSNGSKTMSTGVKYKS